MKGPEKECRQHRRKRGAQGVGLFEAGDDQRKERLRWSANQKDTKQKGLPRISCKGRQNRLEEAGRVLCAPKCVAMDAMLDAGKSRILMSLDPDVDRIEMCTV